MFLQYQQIVNPTCISNLVLISLVKSKSKELKPKFVFLLLKTKFVFFFYIKI